jgi:hypothetical protein
MAIMPLPELPQVLAKAAAIAAAALAVTTEPKIAVVWHEKRGEWAYYSASA